MPRQTSCQWRTLTWAMVAVVLAACEGEIGSLPDRPFDGSGSDARGTAGPTSSEGARAADDAMRADDPDLFALATKYFSGTTPASAPTRLARLTRTQLDLTVKGLLPTFYAETAVATLPRDPLQTNYEYAENLSFNAANFTPFTTWVGELTDRVAATPAGVIDCAAGAQACAATAAEAFVRRSFRGNLSDAQLARFSTFFVASVAEVGMAQATADLVSVVLTSPSFVFRQEVSTDATGRLPPAPWMESLSYTLTDAPPELMKLAPADATRFASDEAFRSQTLDRLLATPEARAKLARFFLAWLEVKEPTEFTIASDVFPEFTPQLATEMIAETRTFLERVLSADEPSLRDITQSTSSLVSRGLRSIYGLTQSSDTGLTELNPSQRLGVFTQPAVITSHSGPSTTRLVKRGVFFTRKMMCLPLGLPPQGVDLSIPELKDATERQRIENGTAQPKCQSCHKSINPFGFMQENYDPIGRFRTEDQGLPIDASISLDILDEGPLTTSTPVDALRGLTSSARFQQCFVRQLFRFYMARDELPGDDPVLRQMFFRFASEGRQDIASLLRVLAGSDTLSARKEKT
jgi:hypothetical protein